MDTKELAEAVNHIRSKLTTINADIRNLMRNDPDLEIEIEVFENVLLDVGPIPHIRFSVKRTEQF
jgi:hypothetical protein